MPISSRLGWCSSVVAAAFFSCAPSAAFGGWMASPGVKDGSAWSGTLLVRTGASAPQGFTALAADEDGIGGLMAATEALVADLPLTGDLTIDAVLTRIEVFGPETELVVHGDDGERRIEAPPVASFRGTAAGHEDSAVFLSVSPWWIYGYAMVGDRTYIISTGPAVDPRPPVVYDLAEISEEDLRIEIPECQADLTRVVEGVARDRRGGSGVTPRSAPCRVARVAFESDYELTQIFGGNATLSTGYIATLTAAMNDIYIRDVNTRMVATYVRVWTTAADPWDQPGAGEQLTQFRNYWVQNMWSVSRNLAHFLSGRGLGGGVAWLSVMCNSQWGFALSGNLAGAFPYPLEDNRGNNWDPFVVAHEFGHNFGTLHTHDGYTPPVDTCGSGNCAGYYMNGTIMSYCHLCTFGMQNIKMRFGDRVSERILEYLALEAPCKLDNPPKFNSHPTDKIVNLGGTVTFTTAVSAPGTMQFQWLHEDQEIPGATSQNLTLTNVAPGNVGSYRLRATNQCLATLSNAATLFIRCPADFDGSLFVDNEDFTSFVYAFVAGDMSADFDKSGFVDIEDYVAFVAAYENGC